VTQKIVYACTMVMFAAALAVYLLSIIGWETAAMGAGVVFFLASVIAVIVATGGTLIKFWRG